MLQNMQKEVLSGSLNISRTFNKSSSMTEFFYCIIDFIIYLFYFFFHFNSQLIRAPSYYFICK